MGGAIEVKSKLGEGTTFTFSATVGTVSEQQARFLTVRRPDILSHSLTRVLSLARAQRTWL